MDKRATADQTLPQTSDSFDPLQKYKKLYFILGALGAVLLFFSSFNPLAAIIGAVAGTGLAWFIIHLVAAGKTFKLDFVRYPLPTGITERQVSEYLRNNLRHPDIEVDKSCSGIKFIYKNSSVHTVRINEKENSFSISSTATGSAKLKNGGKINSANLYRNIVRATPIIRQAIEESVNSLQINGK